MDESGLLAAVIADPTNDEPRLIYADWLEEQKDPRAEFIRAQCALEHMRPNSQGHWRLFHRSDQLSLEFQSEWTTDFPKVVRAFTFRRGFVEAVTVKADEFPAVAEEIFALAPVIELRPSHLSTPKGNRAALLAACPAMANLRVLDLADLKYTANDLLTLLASPYIKSLEEIRCGHLAGIEELRLIADSKKLRRQLRSLALNYCNDVSSFGGRWPKLETLRVDFSRTVDVDQKWSTPKLRRLSLRATGKSAKWPQVFGQFDLSGLEHLQLGGISPMTKPAIVALTNSGCLDTVKSLEIVCVTSRCLELFSEKTLLKADFLKLNGLDLSQKATNVAVEHLAKGKGQLKDLELWYFPFDTSAAELMATATGFSGLESLALQARAASYDPKHEQRDPEHSAAIAVLKDSTLRESLRSLNLPFLDFSHALDLFSKHWPNLESLSIEGGRFSDNQFKRFLDYHTLPQLRDFNVTNTGIGPTELELITNGKYFPDLEYLDARDNLIGGAAIRSVRNANPDLTVVVE